jgi:hypothetical protein
MEITLSDLVNEMVMQSYPGLEISAPGGDLVGWAFSNNHGLLHPVIWDKSRFAVYATKLSIDPNGKSIRISKG